MIDDHPGDQTTERGADALHGRDDALGKIISAGPAHDIGDDERCDCAEDTGLDTVQELQRDQPRGAIRKRVEHCSNGQYGKAHYQNGLSTGSVGCMPHGERYRQHDELRRDDARRQAHVGLQQS